MGEKFFLVLQISYPKPNLQSIHPIMLIKFEDRHFKQSLNLIVNIFWISIYNGHFKHLYRFLMINYFKSCNYLKITVCWKTNIHSRDFKMLFGWSDNLHVKQFLSLLMMIELPLFNPTHFASFFKLVKHSLKFSNRTFQFHSIELYNIIRNQFKKLYGSKCYSIFIVQFNFVRIFCVCKFVADVSQY